MQQTVFCLNLTMEIESAETSALGASFNLSQIAQTARTQAFTDLLL